MTMTIVRHPVLLPLLPLLLGAALVSAGCSTTRPIISHDLRRELRPGGDAVQFPTLDGDTYRLDPNSLIRFVLRGGEVTPWIRGRDLWRSELGISYEERGGIIFIGWEEIAGAEVENLSGGKTVGAIALVAVIVGLVVVLIASKGKGSVGGVGHGVGGGRSRARGVPSFSGRPLSGRRLLRPRGGVHLHVPIIIAVGHGYHAAPPPPPPPPPLPPGPPPPALRPGAPGAPGAPGGEGVVEIHGPPPAVAALPAPSPAVPLFDAPARRRSKIQLITSVAAGTDLVRVQGYTGSLVAGIRLRDVLELGGGLRHAIDPLREGRQGAQDFSLVGFGRLGFHFWLDDHHRFAIPLSVDAGAGHNVRFHLRVNYGLRFAPIRPLWIGLMPFNASYTAFDQDPFDGARRWSFPSTLELGFAY